MASVVDRAKSRLAELRERWPLLDHAIRTQEHYSAVRAGQQAGAVTYYAFLSFFPVLALAVFVVGILARIYPDAHADLADAIDQVIPGLVGDGPGQVSLDQVERFSGWAAVVGLAGVSYAGTGWVSASRASLEVVFERPPWAHPNFVVGKLLDLLSLAVIGGVLFVSVAVAGFLTGFSSTVLGWLDLSDELSWIVYVLTRAVGVAVNALAFFVLFRLVGQPEVPIRALWSGALLGGIAFEVLKALSFLLMSTVTGSPGFQAFGIALILLVWINYFARVVLYAAAWAWTAPDARALRSDVPAGAVQGPRSPSLEELQARAEIETEKK